MTNVIWDKKEVETLKINEMGEKFIWFEATFKDGTKKQTLCFKGEV